MKYTVTVWGLIAGAVFVREYPNQADAQMAWRELQRDYKGHRVTLDAAPKD